MTAQDIINQARERLGDKNEQRWSDNRLLSIVSQGQIDICIESGYIRREVLFPLVVGQSRFVLPRDCITIKRVEHQGILLPLHSRSDLDIPRVEIHSDYVAYKSNLQMNKLEIQPPISELSLNIMYAKGSSTDDTLYVANPYGVVIGSSDPDMTVNPAYGVVTALQEILSAESVSDRYGEIAGSSTDRTSTEFPNGEYGVVVEAEYIFVDTKYGAITEVDGHIVSGKYGITTSVSALEDTVHIFYIASPPKLKFIGATLLLPDIWEELILRYVVGTALQDDNDANNITRGEAELQKYLAKLATIKDLSSKDFSANASDKYETNYRRV